MYTSINYPTKVAIRRAIAERGHAGTVYQPNADMTGAIVPTDGVVSVEGPHFPRPHTWYAQVLLKQGKIVKVVS